MYQNNNLGLNIKYVEKNKDPRKNLINKIKVPKQAITWGLKNQTPKNIRYDCLICDEAHRMLKNVYNGKEASLEDKTDNFIQRFISLCNVSVFFYDEKQSVHIDDYVTKENIKNLALQMGINPENIIERKLIYQHRCNSADKFFYIMDQILYKQNPDLTLKLKKMTNIQSDLWIHLESFLK